MAYGDAAVDDSDDGGGREIPAGIRCVGRARGVGVGWGRAVTTGSGQSGGPAVVSGAGSRCPRCRVALAVAGCMAAPQGRTRS